MKCFPHFVFSDNLNLFIVCLFVFYCKYRIIKAPGGGENNIFGQSGDNQPMNGNGKANGNGSISETESVDGSVISCPSTPVHNGNGNGSQFGYESDTSSTISSTTSSRRGSLQDTKNRLFGQPEGLESPRRRVVDRMKSNIFAEPEPAPVVRSPSVKKYEHGKFIIQICLNYYKLSHNINYEITNENSKK